MSDETQPPLESDPRTGPVTAENLQALYDRIYTEILAKDVTNRRLQLQIDRCEEQIRKQVHLRFVAGAGMRANNRMLKLMAEEELRKQVGVRVLPGFKPRTETSAQFLARMKKRFAEIQDQEEENARKVERELRE